MALSLVAERRIQDGDDDRSSGRRRRFLGRAGLQDRHTRRSAEGTGHHQHARVDRIARAPRAVFTGPIGGGILSLFTSPLTRCEAAP